MGNYVLFAWFYGKWEPGMHDTRGGWQDMLAIFPTKEAAIEAINSETGVLLQYDHWHVVDLLSRKIVAEG